MYLIHNMNQIHQLFNEPEKEIFAYIYETKGSRAQVPTVTYIHETGENHAIR
jgi:hypothetical protein